MNYNQILLLICTLITGCVGDNGSSKPSTSLNTEEIPDETSLFQATRLVALENKVEEFAINDISGTTDNVLSIPESLAKNESSNYEISGYACNIVHDPDATLIWSIQMYHLNTSLADSQIVFGVTKNRKIQSVACTPDGSLLLFSVKETKTGDYEVYAMIPATSEFVQLTDNSTDDVDVTISTDGLTMAWQERLTDGRQAIALRTYNAGWNGFTQKSLASANPFVQPSLSANGDWLALVQLRKSNFLALLHNINTNSFTTIKSIARRKKLFHPSVSNDGATYAWLENNNQSRYVVKNLTAGQSVRVLLNPEGIAHPLLSPDGKWVIYSLNNTDSRRTLITQLDTGDTSEIGVELLNPARYLGTSWQGTIYAAATNPLNDTGITTCSNEQETNLSCPVYTHLNQDADHGRDVSHNDDSDGIAGFSYTKLDAAGNELPHSAETWSCTRDNVSGLTWEVKQGDGDKFIDEGLHDSNDDYYWYSSDENNNAGSPGLADWFNGLEVFASCSGYDVNNPASFCNTEAFVNRVNKQGLCGKSDWRLPSREELRSIVNYGHIYSFPYSNTLIDTNYFPNTNTGIYWTSSPDATSDHDAWGIFFNSRNEQPLSKYSAYYVRLVH